MRCTAKLSRSGALLVRDRSKRQSLEQSGLKAGTSVERSSVRVTTLAKNIRIYVAPMGEIALERLRGQHIRRKAAELRRYRSRKRRHVGARRQITGLAENLLTFPGHDEIHQQPRRIGMRRRASDADGVRRGPGRAERQPGDRSASLAADLGVVRRYAEHQ